MTPTNVPPHDVLDEQLDRLTELSKATEQQIVWLSMIAIARVARRICPGAVYVGLSRNSDNACMFPDGYYTHRMERIVNGLPSSWEHELDTLIRQYCESLTDANGWAWEPFTTECVDGQMLDNGDCRLSIDKVLAGVGDPATPHPDINQVNAVTVNEHPTARNAAERESLNLRIYDAVPGYDASDMFVVDMLGMTVTARRRPGNTTHLHIDTTGVPRQWMPLDLQVNSAGVNTSS